MKIERTPVPINEVVTICLESKQRSSITRMSCNLTSKRTGGDGLKYNVLIHIHFILGICLGFFVSFLYLMKKNSPFLLTHQKLKFVVFEC